MRGSVEKKIKVLNLFSESILEGYYSGSGKSVSIDNMSDDCFKSDDSSYCFDDQATTRKGESKNKSGLLHQSVEQNIL